MACQKKSDENEKTVIELVHLICLKASSCSLMRSGTLVSLFAR